MSSPILLDKEEGLRHSNHSLFFVLRTTKKGIYFLAAFHVHVVTPVMEGDVVPDSNFPTIFEV